jgi:hypothetical protein
MSESQGIIGMAGPAFELMCLTARVDFDSDAAARATRLLADGIDWSAFLAGVERHYVAPLVHRNLKSMPDAAIPARGLQTLRVRSKLTAFKSEMFAAELIRLARLFEARGVRSLNYKGAVTAHELYGSVTLRNFNDLDFLVHRDDLRTVIEILEARGYTNSEQFTHAQFDHYVRQFKEFVFTRGEIYLEPHWSLAGRRFRFDADFEGFWKRSRMLAFQDSQLRVMSPEDSLLVLCLVGAKGRWKRLQMVTDVAACVGRFPHLDWACVEALAAATGTVRILHLGLLLAAELAGLRLPAEIDRRVREKTAVRRLARDFTRTLAVVKAPSRFLPNSPALFSRMLFRQRESFRDRLHYLWHTTTTPDLLHLRRMPIPKVAFPLYRIFVPLHDYVLYPVWQLGKSVLARHPAAK